MKSKNLAHPSAVAGKMLDHPDVTATHPGSLAVKRVNVDFPGWMVQSLDREADRIGVTRQSLIKMWLADRLAQEKNR